MSAALSYVGQSADLTKLAPRVHCPLRTFAVLLDVTAGGSVRICYPSPIVRGLIVHGTWTFATAIETAAFHGALFSESAMALRDRGVCVVQPGGPVWLATKRGYRA